ncbi:MAG: hypothetical protein JST15_13720 [Bacteroidetes bacterium]|nr:hypothetical protein [Bacteroidota bacterium]
MIKIITTVGTSLFTNYEKSEIMNLLGEDHQSISDCIGVLLDNPTSNADLHKSEVNKIKEVICKKWTNGIIKRNGIWEKDINSMNENMSAEIQTIKKILDQIQPNNVEIAFVSSDTILSKLAMEILSDQIINIYNGLSFSKHVIKDLRIDNLNIFERGLLNLVEKLRELIVSGNGTDTDTFSETNINRISENNIINISGGYKAILPYVTIFAQVYKIKLQYIFEDSDELITIPQLPLGFDELFIEEMYLDLLKTNLNSPLLILKLQQYNLIRKSNGNNFRITALGKIVKDFAENMSPSSKSVFGYIVEFKLYEYFIENPISYNNVKLKDIKHSDISTNLEIDLIMKKDNNYCFSEVKSINQFIGNEDLKNKYKKQLKTIQDHFNGIKFLFHFYIYTVLDSVNETELISKCNKYKNINDEIDVHFYLVILSPDSKTFENENPYQKYVRSKIKTEYIKEINL